MVDKIQLFDQVVSLLDRATSERLHAQVILSNTLINDLSFVRHNLSNFNVAQLIAIRSQLETQLSSHAFLR